MVETKICLRCNKLIHRTLQHKNCWQLVKYCSTKCRGLYNYFNFSKYTRSRQSFRSKKIIGCCLWCSKKYFLNNHLHKYCSRFCLKKYRYRKISQQEYLKRELVNCLFCNKPFNYDRHPRKCCSLECMQKRSELLRSSKFGQGRIKEKAKRFKISIDDYLRLSKSCSICSFDKFINIHHILPKSRHGQDIIENYMSVCSNCHKFIHSGYSVVEIKEYYKNKNITNQKSLESSQLPNEVQV